MSWRDRAVADQAPASTGGGWRDRASSESNSSQPQGDYWDDVGRNAMEGVKQIPSMFKQSAEPAMKIGRAMIGGYPESAAQVMQGKPFRETPVGQAADAGWDMAKGVRDAAWQGVKDTGSLIKAPFENVPMGQTEIGKKFRERPISVPLGVAGTVAPMFKGARMASTGAKNIFAGAEPNFLERAGARGINNSLGVSAGTVEDMATRGANPGKVGIDLGLTMADEGLAGKGPTKGYDSALKMQKTYGKAVDTALQNIKKANRAFGEYPELADPLKVDANSVVKPFLDRANELQKSGYPNERFESRFHRAVYNDLQNSANVNNGFIGIDDVRGQMQKIGKMMGSASDDHLKVLKKIYSNLANTQDQMITEIADQAGNPQLKQALLDANAGYSRYARVLPDIKSAASKQSVKTGSIFSPRELGSEIIGPKVSKWTLGAGKMLRGGAEVADKATGIPGQIFDKGLQVAGDRRGAIFPEHALPPGMKGREMFTPSEQRYKVNELTEQQYLDNYDFENALKAKWGMHSNSYGNVMPEDIAVPPRRR